MIEHTAGFAAAVAQSHRRASRLLILDANLQVVDEYGGDEGLILDGSVTSDRNREQRRTCSLRLSNSNGQHTPTGPASPFRLNGRMRIERGLYVAGAPEWVALGTFLIDDPEVLVAEGGTTLTLAGRDRSKLALFSNFTAPYTVAAGARIADIVRVMAQDAGMGASDTLYRLDDDGLWLGVSRTWEEGQNRLQAMMQLAHDHALELYADALGVWTMRRRGLVDASLPVWTFARGEQAIMLGLTKRLSDAQLFNHTLVVGEGADFGPYRGEARDLNPASPVYNPPDGSGPVGDRIAPVHRSALITSRAQAQEVAEVMLREVALVEEQIAIPSAPHPALEAGDVVRITEAHSATDDTYLLDTVVQPVGGGIMQLDTKQVRALTA